MTDQTNTPTQETAAIHDVARHARRVRFCIRALCWATMPPALVIVSAVLLSLVYHRPPGSVFLFWFLALFSLLPMFPALVCMVIEQSHTFKTWDRFMHLLAPRQGQIKRIWRGWELSTDLSASNQEEIRGKMSVAEIGPLLEVTLTAARRGGFLNMPAALLVSLLSSLREADEVVLTQEQRGLLHELVIHQMTIRNGVEIAELALPEVRPAAISALALLGNRSSLPVLERFARKTHDPALRQAALQSADQIRERMPYDPKQMLRAANAPERTETLLRAATADKSTDNSSQQLLRANLSENPSEPEQ